MNKQLKKISILLLLLCILSGCSNSKQQQSTDNSQEFSDNVQTNFNNFSYSDSTEIENRNEENNLTTTEPTSSPLPTPTPQPQPVDISLITNDAISLSSILFPNIEVTNLEIIKRQTNLDSKEDLIYVHLEAENNDFSIVRNYKLVYLLYNDGWLLEESSSYEDNEYYDQTTPLHGVDTETVNAYFASISSTDVLEDSAFRNTASSITCSDINNYYFGPNADSYQQEITFIYDLFTRTALIDVTYVLDEYYSWVPNLHITNTYTLNDSISGQWGRNVPASHPMHIDSTILLNLEKIDYETLHYDFLWTSRMEGGYDDSCNGSYTISPCFNDNAELIYIVIGYNNWDCEFRITPHGVIYKSATEEYILIKIS